MILIWASQRQFPLLYQLIIPNRLFYFWEEKNCSLVPTSTTSTWRVITNLFEGNKSVSSHPPWAQTTKQPIQSKMDQRVLAVFVFIILVIFTKCLYWVCKISRVANFFRGIFSSYQSRCRRSLRRSRRIHPQENFVRLTTFFGLESTLMSFKIRWKDDS